MLVKLSIENFDTFGILTIDTLVSHAHFRCNRERGTLFRGSKCFIVNHAELRVLMSRALAIQHHFKFRDVEVIRCQMLQGGWGLNPL